MKSKLTAILAIAFILLATACGNSLKVTTDYDRTASFAGFKTFDFYQLKDHGGSISDLNKNRIVNAIITEMKAKGFTQNSSNPDILVNATAILKSKQSVTANTNYYGAGGYYRPYGWGAGYGGTTTYNVYDYKDGSLIIDFIRASDNQLVWQGTGNKEIDKPSSDPDKAIADAVHKILAEYPPGAKK